MKLNWTEKDFTFNSETIGEGGFGTVICAIENVTKLKYAIKLVENADARTTAMIRMEIDNHAGLCHHHVVKLHGYFENRRYMDTCMYLVMDYIDGDNLYNIVSYSQLPKSLAPRYISHIAKALAYCHQQHIVHRDVKLENIMIDSNNDIAILIDFGWSARCTPGACELTEKVGTLDYFSPEMLNKEKYDEKVDIWSLGICTYELLVGCAPFVENYQKDTCDRIKVIDLRLPSSLSTEEQDFISSILCQSKDRSTIAQLLLHPWITYINPVPV